MDTYSSLDMVAALVGNEKMKQKILNCKEAIHAGANFAEALTGAGIFNHLYSQMVSVGFRSGNVDMVLRKSQTAMRKIPTADYSPSSPFWNRPLSSFCQ